MSLAPSSRITACVPSGTDQSRRASPPDMVSPETPALPISTVKPLAVSAFSSLTGNAALAGRPKPAVSESPSATIRTGPSAAAAREGSPHGKAPPRRMAASAIVRASIWTPAPRLPYERGAAIPRDVNRRGTSRSDAKDLTTDGIQGTSMHDTSGLGTSAAIALSGINLSLGRGATRVHILKDVDLHIGTGQAGGLG